MITKTSNEDLNRVEVLPNKRSMILEDEGHMARKNGEASDLAVKVFVADLVDTEVKEPDYKSFEVKNSEEEEVLEVEVTATSVLDKSFTLRQLITNRFSTENYSFQSDTNLIVQAIVESLRTNDSSVHNDEGLKSIVRRALAPTEAENAFLNIDEFERAVQSLNACDLDVDVDVVKDSQNQTIQSNELVFEVSTESDFAVSQVSHVISKPNLHAEPSKTAELDDFDTPEPAPTSLLSRLEKIQRSQETTIAEKTHAITRGAVLNGRYVILDLQNKSKLLTTYKALDVMSDKGVVIDVLNSKDRDHNEMFANACKTLINVNHKNLIETIECVDSFDQTLCVRESIEGQTLSSIVNQSNSHTEGQIASILSQLCDVLSDLHRRGFAHGNLNTDNVLITQIDGESIVKVGGIGSNEVKAQLIDQRTLRLDQDLYGSFERYSQLRKQSSTDMYDLAAIAFQLVSGTLPFADTNGDVEQVLPLSHFRPELIEIDHLDRVIRCALLLNDDEKLDGPDEFKTRISGWLKLVSEADPSKANTSFDPVINQSKASEDQITVDQKEDDADSSFMPSRMFAKLLLDSSEAEEAKCGRKSIDQKQVPSTDQDGNGLVGQVLFGRYSVIDTVGKGNNSIVYAAMDLKFDRIVAIKQLPPPTPECEPVFNKAIDKFKTFQHPNLIRFLDCRSIDDSPCLILEYAEGETLRSLLNRIHYIDTEARIGRIVVQICSLMSYLHAKTFAHGNLSTNNIILVESSGDSSIKIGGLCSSGIAFESLDSAGTTHSADLEKSSAERIQSDINTIAAIMYEMVTGIKLDADDHRDDEELIAISAMRPELFEVESLKAIIKKGLSRTEGFKTTEQLKNAVLAWMDKVNKAFASTELPTQPLEPVRKDLLEKERSNRDRKMPVSKRWAKQYQGIKFIEAELRDELNTLKTNQVKSEATIAMIVSRTFAAKRQRKSPVRAVAEVALISTAVVLTGAAVVNYFSTNYETMKTKYLMVARALSKPTAKTPAEIDQPMPLLDYSQDSAYKRWSNSREFGAPRRIEVNGQLREKK